MGRLFCRELTPAITNRLALPGIELCVCVHWVKADLLVIPFEEETPKRTKGLWPSTRGQLLSKPTGLRPSTRGQLLSKPMGFVKAKGCIFVEMGWHQGLRAKSMNPGRGGRVSEKSSIPGEVLLLCQDIGNFFTGSFLVLFDGKMTEFQGLEIRWNFDCMCWDCLILSSHPACFPSSKVTEVTETKGNGRNGNYTFSKTLT